MAASNIGAMQLFSATLSCAKSVVDKATWSSASRFSRRSAMDAVRRRMRRCRTAMAVCVAKVATSSGFSSIPDERLRANSPPSEPPSNARSAQSIDA